MSSESEEFPSVSAGASASQGLPESDSAIGLQSQLESLRRRVKELEDENAKLSSQLSSGCWRCREMNGNASPTLGDDVGSVKNVKPLKACSETKKPAKNMPGTKNYVKMMRYPSKRYVALRVMYFGHRFYGFALEAQMEPTVESELFRALEKTKLLLGDKKEIQYSRCGRTDKGVSSVGQVIALFLPSNLKDSVSENENSGKIVSEDKHEGEIDYVRLLNRVLPKDIRVMGWSPAPHGFSARFSCLSREYMYLFWRENLDVMAMESAAKKFVGEHDFRNFCKMDAMNVHNYRRHITSFEIFPCSKRFEGNELWAIKVRGSAFLWHQVRCMVSVLFMVGQGHEFPEVIDVLLDVERTSRKPQYIMASEVPLVLCSCEFEGLSFTCSSDSKKALSDHLEDEWRSYKLQAAIFYEAVLACKSIENDQSTSLNNRVIKKRPIHIPLMSRPSEPSYEERRAKFNSRAQA